MSHVADRLEGLREVDVEVLVVGGGVGGVAAALAAARWGRHTLLASETDWLGGQFSTQGVSHLDEHPLIEQAGATAAYRRFREQIRSWYLTHYPNLRHTGEPLNPGNAWVSRLSYEPRVGALVADEMLHAHVTRGHLKVERNVRPVGVHIEGYRIVWVDFENRGGGLLRVHATYVLEATETGELLPLAGIPFRVGAEGRDDMGEPAAPEEARPEWVQSITYPFALEYVPGGSYVIPRPRGYEQNRSQQPYSLQVRPEASAEPLRYQVFEVVQGTPGSFWQYRRILDAHAFRDSRVPYDVSMINWPANDARVGHLLLSPNPLDRKRALEEARLLSLGFVHWLQTECPRDDGGHGYPEFRLRPDVMGSRDGLAQRPYVRESRRIVGETSIRQQDIDAAFHPGARATLFPDSVGVGWYAIDIHAADGEGHRYLPTRPFQIPLGALIPQHLDNLLASGLSLGASRLAAAAYRVHPVEWAIGEAAGAVATTCLDWGVRPRDLRSSDRLLRRSQARLLGEGIPLFWFDDLPLRDPEFASLQMNALVHQEGFSPNHLHRPPIGRAPGNR